MKSNEAIAQHEPRESGAPKWRRLVELNREKRDQALAAQQQAAHASLAETPAPTFTEVALATLRVDASYQRTRVDAKVLGLLAEFQAGACQPLAVSQRADGTRYLVDGQHRKAVLEMLGVQTWHAVIYTKLTPQAEAAMWRRINTGQTKPPYARRFKALLREGNLEAHAIARIVKAADYQLSFEMRSRSKGKSSGRIIEAIEAIVRIYRLGGEAALRDTLEVIAEAWDDTETARTHRVILRGIHRVLSTAWNVTLDRAHLVKSLEHLSPTKWIGKTTGGDAAPEELFMQAVRVLYNRGLKRSSRLVVPVP